MTDLLGIDALLSEEEKATRDRVAALVDEHIRPHVAQWYEDAVLPESIFPVLAEAGLFGMHLEGYGCAGRTAVEYGLAMQELEAGDSGIRTVVSVQGSLAMSAIYKHGSEEQKQQWLPKMAAGDVIGCFGLTEPTAGSDPAGMATVARYRSGEWIIDGAKRWIGLASVAGVAIIWAKVDEEDASAAGVEAGVRGFIVPTSTPGFRATPITRKLSMRASIQCDILLDGVTVPGDALLPKHPGLKGPFMCLNEARFGISFGALGAARDSLEVALKYAKERKQFDRSLASFQLTQQKLVDMAVELNKGQLLALNLGRAKDAGTLEPYQISVGKLANCRTAIEICRQARTILGGNGVTADYSPLRHAANLESVRTYEGADEIHTLILGRVLTGEQAFS
ncbi:acyl-CoA dehydrogenase family protein [Corynebacterium sp. B5-R-101]|uniref:glutaryl-CoA dehydrogenase (ETF) n=1 Tax=Corynebacterium intestinale TaxID=2943492 RepID=A0ABT0TBJ8_9CORY|nr:acyl-CoA dehydrogenase family protein [Corynebacterium intestinale]MCL8494316.1 acyl-CoA dehydrogenase family protein [Corynebacterium intestinale]MCP1390552.1 acyl-CoA dehydrogenase family protein [Corynebacterium intestinale]